MRKGRAANFGSRIHVAAGMYLKHFHDESKAKDGEKFVVLGFHILYINNLRFMGSLIPNSEGLGSMLLLRCLRRMKRRNRDRSRVTVIER